MLWKLEKAKVHCVVAWVSKRTQPLKVKEDKDKEETDWVDYDGCSPEWLTGGQLVNVLINFSQFCNLPEKPTWEQRPVSDGSLQESREKRLCRGRETHLQCTEAGVSPEGWTAAREIQEPAQDIWTREAAGDIANGNSFFSPFFNPSQFDVSTCLTFL